MENMTKQRILKFFKNISDYLVEKGYEVKFKNLNEIIDEISEIIQKSLDVNKGCIVQADIKMEVDTIEKFHGEFIFTPYDDIVQITYFKMERYDFIDIERQKDLIGTGNISFELSIRHNSKEKISLLIRFLQERTKFVRNFEILADVTLCFEISVKFNVVKYIIWRRRNGKHEN